MEKINPLTPVPALTGCDELGLSSTSDVIPFDQNWHCLYSTCAGGKGLSNDAQIRVTGQMEPEICTKMLKKLSEKISCHYTWLLHHKNYSSRWRFLRSFLTPSKPSRRSITAAKEWKRRKRKGEKCFSKIEKPKDVGHSLLQKKNLEILIISAHAWVSVIKRDASGKNG